MRSVASHLALIAVLAAIAVTASDCVVSEWSAWSQCSMPCEGGEQTRTRTVLKSGSTCPYKLSESRSCNTGVPCDVEVVEVTNCDEDSVCTKGCTTNTFNQNECLQEKGSSKTVKLSCPSASSVCVRVEYFEDSDCHARGVSLNTVCGNCNNEFMIVCGALQDAVIYVYNCTGGDSADCGNCGASKAIPFDTCTAVDGQAVIIRKAANCNTVNMIEYTGPSCTGNKTSFQYPDDKCVVSTRLQCVNSTTPAPTDLTAIKLKKH